MAAPFAHAAYTHDKWDVLLHSYVEVHEGGKNITVDYSGMAGDRILLSEYLEQLSRVSRQHFDSLSKDDRLAFLINAYNGWTVELPLTGGHPGITSIKGLGLRACQQITWPYCISSSGHLWLQLNRKILNVALLRLRFYADRHNQI